MRPHSPLKTSAKNAPYGHRMSLKRRSRRLSLPVAIVLTAAPLVLFCTWLFYITWAMNLYHPHSSDVQVLRRIVPITPRTSKPGRVTEVMVSANNPLKKGDVLFAIDPKPFEFEVTQLQALLAASQPGTPELQAALDRAVAARERAEVLTTQAQESYELQTEFRARGAITQAALDAAKRNLEAAVQSETDAHAAEERARRELTSAASDKSAVVAQVRQQLAAAAKDLAETNVIAPCDGFAPSVDIPRGRIVSAATAVMQFVCDVEEGSRDSVVATLPQGAYPGVKAGAAAEVIFSTYPGRVFMAKVDGVIEITSSRQIAVGSDIFAITPPSAELPRLAMILKIDDPNFWIPADAHGEATVYADHAPFTGTLRKGLMRMKAMINYFL